MVPFTVAFVADEATTADGVVKEPLNADIVPDALAFDELKVLLYCVV